MTEHSYLTPDEVAEHYRTTLATVRYWRKHGLGPRGLRSGKRVIYPRTEVERHDRALLNQLGGALPEAAHPPELVARK